MNETSNKAFKDIEKQKLEIAIREQNLKLLKSREEESKINSRIRKLLDEQAEVKKANDNLIKSKTATSNSLKIVNEELNGVKKELKVFNSELSSKCEELRKQEDSVEQGKVENTKRTEYLDTLKKDIDLSTINLEKRIKDLDVLSNNILKEKEIANKLTKESMAREAKVAESEKVFKNTTDRFKKQQEDFENAKLLFKKEKGFLDRDRSYASKCVEEAEKERLLVADKKVKLDMAIASCDIETKKMETKQRSLENNIQELKNDEGRIEISRLKVLKLINDNKSIGDLDKLKKELLK